MNKIKIIFLNSLLITAVSIPLFSLHHYSLPTDYSEKQQSQTKKKIESTRHVTKFTASQHNDEEDLFANLQNLQFHSNLNINVLTSGKSSVVPNFSFVIHYSYYVENNVKIHKNKVIRSGSKPIKIKVGVQLLSDLSVNLGKAPNKNTKHLSLFRNSDLNYALVAPASVTYSIIPSGFVNNAKINFMRNFNYRVDSGKDSITIHSEKIGFFNIFNINKFIVNGMFITVAGRIFFRLFIRYSSQLLRTKAPYLWVNMSRSIIKNKILSNLAIFGRNNNIDVKAEVERKIHERNYSFDRNYFVDKNKVGLFKKSKKNLFWHSNTKYNLSITLRRIDNPQNYHTFIFSHFSC